jgi:hypothetical protein
VPLSLNATFRFLLTQPTIHHSFLQHQLHPSREALDCVHVLDGPDGASSLATLDPRLSPLSTRSFSFWSAPAHRLSSSTLHTWPRRPTLPACVSACPPNTLHRALQHSPTPLRREHRRPSIATYTTLCLRLGRLSSYTLHLG